MQSGRLTPFNRWAYKTGSLLLWFEIKECRNVKAKLMDQLLCMGHGDRREVTYGVCGVWCVDVAGDCRGC